MKRRLVLTRGEVKKIVEAHLHKSDRLPPEALTPGASATSIAALSPETYKFNPLTAPWSEWPAYMVEWVEEIPE